LCPGVPGDLYRAWANGGFTLLVAEEQIRELRQTLAKPTLAARVRPHRAGRLVNNLRRMAEDVGRLPHVQRSPDPEDDFLLAMAEPGKADYLVTGDKSGLLTLVRHSGARILTAREFVEILG
jgi:predicted nucleic acid-binding protein